MYYSVIVIVSTNINVSTITHLLIPKYDNNNNNSSNRTIDLSKI